MFQFYIESRRIKHVNNLNEYYRRRSRLSISLRFSKENQLRAEEFNTLTAQINTIVQGANNTIDKFASL